MPHTSRHSSNVTCEWDHPKTPGVKLVIVDTGSGATVFPCEECTGCGDSYHTDGYFKQSQSMTFREVTCDECFQGSCASMLGGGKCKVKMSYAEGSSWTAYESMYLCYVGGPHDQALEGLVRWVAAGPKVDQLIRWRYSNLHLN
mmetsp:Transcript_24718/g.40093  ORF Transcript_24718/g.40093 Transcript_24718/m.40093 type:complete len:144 (+) Transcript_24718:274-705(+)